MLAAKVTALVEFLPIGLEALGTRAVRLATGEGTAERGPGLIRHRGAHDGGVEQNPPQARTLRHASVSLDQSHIFNRSLVHRPVFKRTVVVKHAFGFGSARTQRTHESFTRDDPATRILPLDFRTPTYEGRRPSRHRTKAWAHAASSPRPSRGLHRRCCRCCCGASPGKASHA